VAENDRSGDLLLSRALQQEAVARLGQKALGRMGLPELFAEAVAAVGRILAVEYCEVLEFLPDRNRLCMRAGLPGVEAWIGKPVIDAGEGSQAGYTLRCRGPVVMPDIDAERRFTPHALMRAHGIVSGVSVVIEGRRRPFGVLNASSVRRRDFSEPEIHFLTAVANVLASAVERREIEEALRRSRRAARGAACRQAALAKIGRIVGSTLAIEDVYEGFARQAAHILPFDRITLTRIHRDTATVEILFFAGPSVPDRRLRQTYPLAGTLSERLLATRRGVRYCPSSAAELSRRYPSVRPMWDAGFRSFLLAPLVHRDEIIGALVLSSRTPQAYGPGELQTAEHVALQVSGAVANALLHAELQKTARTLEEREGSLQTLLRVAPVGIGVVRDRILVQANAWIADLLGLPASELAGSPFGRLFAGAEEFERVARDMYWSIRERGGGAIETRWRHRDGSARDVRLSFTPLDPADWGRGVMFTALDRTAERRAEAERLRLEGQLRQAQKMEAIGTLAGGIAHDFNNILAAILGFSELARFAAAGGEDPTPHLLEILKASYRARDLVRQILAFSRRTESAFAPVPLRPLVNEALKLLRATLPATIRLRERLEGEGRVLGDPTQIHQVVMNLCTNAYQAMEEEGGELEVSLAEQRPAAAPEEVSGAGRFLRLRVRDTGPGMDPAILNRIFDPYFTTKEPGKGTGLGLAVVHGIVKQHRGRVEVASRPGGGATFDVYFPLLEEQEAPSAGGRGGPAPAGNGERLLFIDDEPALVALAEAVLTGLNYRVIATADARAGLELFCSDPHGFDLVITDMTMPQMTGDRLAREILRLRPGLPVLLCTGYSERLTEEGARRLGAAGLLWKPYLREELAAAVRRALDPAQEAAGHLDSRSAPRL